MAVRERKPWRTWDASYEGYGYKSEGRRRLAPRPEAKRTSSRRSPGDAWELRIWPRMGDTVLVVSERRVSYRVGVRLVNWLRRRGHLAILG
jgi:hypothetical protein